MGEFDKINFKKKFGQNFISDKNLINSIVKDSKITLDDVVVEIGVGAGTLTKCLAENAKKVIAFEIDEELKPLLEEKFNDNSNVSIIFEDFLNVDENLLNDLVGGEYKVVANLPYYITTPILTKLFEFKNRPKTISVMVQKEVGERIVATNKSREYGYFSVFVQANADAKIVRNVNRKMFTPVPNVDSVIVRLDLKDNVYEKGFFDFLKMAFAMKRKTLVNNVEKLYSLTKAEIEEKFETNGVSKTVRADSLSLSQLYDIYSIFK